MGWDFEYFFELERRRGRTYFDLTDYDKKPVYRKGGDKNAEEARQAIRSDSARLRTPLDRDHGRDGNRG